MRPPVMRQGQVLPFPAPAGGAPPALAGQGPVVRMSWPQPSSLEVVGNEANDGRTAEENLEVQDDGGLSGEKLLAKYRAWETAKSGERAEAEVSWRYYHGKQWTEAQVAVLRQRKQLPTYYNRIRRKINFLVGTEQRLRRDPKGFARHPQFNEGADIATHVLRFVQDKTDAPSAHSMAARDFFVSGIAVLYQGAATVGKNTDPTKLHCPSGRFFYDPRSEKPDFSDSKFLGLWQWVETDTAIEMMEALGAPDAAERIKGLANHHALGYAGVPAEWQKAKAWVDATTESVKLLEMYYRHRGVWRLAFLCGDVKLYDKPSIFKNEDGTSRHAFNATSCSIGEDGDRYGIVRDMIPVQDQINHRLSKLLHMMSTRQVIFETGSFKDPKRAQREMMRSDGMIEVAPGVMERKAFQIVTFDAEIRGQAELLQSAVMEIENIGPNPGLVGRGEGINQQSGRAILAQQNAGMTELSPEFENIRAWKLKGYRNDWACCRQFWTGERFVRITARDGSPAFVGINQVRMMAGPNGIPLPQVSNTIAQLDVDITLDEGPDTITVREELMQTFASLGEAAMGPLGKIMIELSNTPDKDRLVALIDGMLQPPPEMQAMQAKLAELETALKEAQVGKAQADTAAQHASTENKRADTLVKLTSIMMPPEALDGSFPRGFSDTPGVQPPKPSPQELGIPDAFVLPSPPEAPDPGGRPGADGGVPADAGPNGFIPDGPAPGPFQIERPAAPGDDPRLGQAGTLPMPSRPGELPAQGVDAFA